MKIVLAFSPDLYRSLDFENGSATSWSNGASAAHVLTASHVKLIRVQEQTPLCLLDFPVGGTKREVIAVLRSAEKL